ncbi:MAG: hypothetical protein VX910_06800 [Candidatus Latescibacterota bacterium]|nr:hypothetical protein [Candidatus Latescibacterota bacterium]
MCVITAAFAGGRHAPYRVGMKFDYEEGFIEVTVVSLMVGEHFRSKLDRLTEQIGCPVHIRQSENLKRILLDARCLTPKSRFHLARQGSIPRRDMWSYRFRSCYGLSTASS